MFKLVVSIAALVQTCEVSFHDGAVGNAAFLKRNRQVVIPVDESVVRLLTRLIEYETVLKHRDGPNTFDKPELDPN